jgi:thiosulfate/3-mercaptopyruvate sulfurtransferase
MSAAGARRALASSWRNERQRETNEMTDAAPSPHASPAHVDPAAADPALPAPLVSPRWLAQALADRRVCALDASWHLPTAGRDARAEHAQAHIPGAPFFDIDALSDRASDLPHMLPDAQAFAQAMGALGVADDMILVVYDSVGLFSAPRAWWTLRTFGARDVRVLDGGLPAWRALGLAVESGAVTRAPASFAARLNAGSVAAMEDVRAALAAGSAQVADARSAERFAGKAPEPRAGLSAGHMPGARNLPMGGVLAQGRMKAPQEILAAFAQAGLDPDRPMITSCGSGVTAAVLNLALACAGKPQPRLYDGSWTEWASRGGAVERD